MTFRLLKLSRNTRTIDGRRILGHKVEISLHLKLQSPVSKRRQVWSFFAFGLAPLLPNPYNEPMQCICLATCPTRHYDPLPLLLMDAITRYVQLGSIAWR